MTPLPMGRPRSAPDAEGGFVLVAVLWMLAALAILASVYSVYAINTTLASHVYDDRLQADASIRAGIELTALEQLTVPESVRPAQGQFSGRVGRTNVSVRYLSEAARIDLNAAPQDLLAGLFAALGVDRAHAETFAERIVGWRTKAAANVPSKEAKLYADWHVPYPPRQAPFNSALELSLIPGIPEAIVERLLPLVTVFSGRPNVDVRSADPLVLSALPGVTSEILAKVLKARASGLTDERGLLDMLGAARSYASIDPAPAIRAQIEVEFDNGRRVRAEVVFRLKDGGDDPYDLIYWRDNYDGATQST